MMRGSESKGWKVAVVCERIKLSTTIIKLSYKMKWANIREGCCVVFTILWNNNYLQ